MEGGYQRIYDKKKLALEVLVCWAWDPGSNLQYQNVLCLPTESGA
jgi:hypothetical protein